MPQVFKGDIPKDILSGVGITTLLFVVSVYLPILGFFCAVFIPLPIIFYRAKLGRKNGAAVPVVALMIMAIILGRLSIDLFFFAQLMLLGFALGEFYELNLTVEKTVGYATGIVLAGGVIFIFFYSNQTHSSIYALVSDYVAKNLELSLALYKNMGMSAENVQMISNSLPSIQYVLVRLVPALVSIAVLFGGWVNILISKHIFLRKGLFYPDFGALTHWKAPEYLVWGVIGCGLALLLPDRTFKMVGLNGLLFFMIIFFFQGIAIVAFYFDKKLFPNFVRFFLYSLIALQQLLLLVVIGIGFFDVWANFRKLEINKSK